MEGKQEWRFQIHKWSSSFKRIGNYGEKARNHANKEGKQGREIRKKIKHALDTSQVGPTSLHAPCGAHFEENFQDYFPKC